MSCAWHTKATGYLLNEYSLCTECHYDLWISISKFNTSCDFSEVLWIFLWFEMYLNHFDKWYRKYVDPITVSIKFCINQSCLGIAINWKHSSNFVPFLLHTFFSKITQSFKVFWVFSTDWLDTYCITQSSVPIGNWKRKAKEPDTTSGYRQGQCKFPEYWLREILKETSSGSNGPYAFRRKNKVTTEKNKQTNKKQ